MKKQDLIEILNSIRTDENSLAIDKVIAKVKSLSDEDMYRICDGKSIAEIKQILIDNVNKFLLKRKEEPWKNLNEIFCYGRTGNTIHIHLIPSDLRPLKQQLGDEGFNNFIKRNLANALARLQEVFKADTTMGEVFAVSPIFYHPDWKEIHESLGFETIQEIMPGTGMDHFLEMFNKDDGKAKRVFFTKMEREQFLQNEYEQSAQNERS